jgi:drug/metabolite transporter (DMT)-like permease
MDETAVVIPDQAAPAVAPAADRSVVFALGATVIIWGSAFAYIRMALKAYGPGEMALLRLAFASVALGINAVLRGIVVPKLEDWPRVITLGFLW